MSYVYILSTQGAAGSLSPLASLSTASLILTVLLCGGYAGMVLMCHVGVMPAMMDLSPRAFADAWCAMDTYMARRMPPYKASLLALNAAALVALSLQGNRTLAAAAALSLLCSGAGLLLTVRRQLPLNAQLKAAGRDSSEDFLRSIRSETAAGFRVRLALAVLAFSVLVVGAFLSPAL